MTTGEILKKLRRERGLTLEQVGEICGITKCNISRWEDGTVKNVDRGHLQTLADYYGVSLTYLLTGGEEPEDMIREPDVRAIARAGKRMTAEQRKNVIRYMLAFYPEAFDDGDGRLLTEEKNED